MRRKATYGLYIFRFGTDLQIRSSDASARIGRPFSVRSIVLNDGTISETAARWTMPAPGAQGVFACK